MEAGPNCSSHCESGVCFIYPGVNSQQGWDVLQRLCALSARGVDLQSRSLSPALRAVVWTLLSCGILLALFFLIFTLRFKNNRIVKMSSPNLNVLTLCGSVLTYGSGFLFAMEERALLSGAGSRAVLQARIWTLCIGSSLVFGPILGKTWRLYRVFTQRVPDKRVIIRDIQLMGLVALLVLVDVVVLAAWGLTDPIKCSRSVSAMVKVVERDASYSLSQLDSCSSLYSDLWVILLSVLKGSLLLYGTYLAGLTSNVSLPPVNQSVTIIGAVCLVTMSSAVAVPVSLYLYAWPNVVYSVVSGAIFICTMAIDCLLFVPQLTQWRQFEEETNSHPSQMAKYFSSPSKTTHSMYSEDEIYYLLGENDSMKRLINEKNAVIDSLQEQVNNAKDKLLKLMTASHPLDEGEMDSSNTNLNSTSTQTTVVSPDSPTLMKYSEVAPTRAFSPPPYVPPPPLPAHTTSQQTSPEGPVATEVPPSSTHLRSSPPQDDSEVPQVVSLNENTEEVAPTMNNIRNSGLGKEISEKPLDVPLDQDKLAQGFSRLGPAWCSSSHVESPGPSASVELPTMSPTGRMGFVTNEQLVEILQDLSMDAISSSVKSPDRARSPSLNPDELGTALSPRSPLQFFFPTISPYLMRKRRPPFYSSRGGPPPYYFPGSVPPGRGRASALMDNEKLRDDDSQRHDLWDERKRRRRNAKAQARRGSGQESWECSSHKCTITPFTGQVPQPASAEGVKHSEEPYDYSDSDSSSSEDYCYYQRPYCGACHHPYDSTDSLTSGTSDSEDEDFCHSGHPVVNFKVDLKPTFV
ncbi:probable G-protein coupled receptor 156 [Labeo rohita]|uniref:probable G-protein coupled receptor 156 n=1 Tax=Labeo rohita TaxID=84645 RepID=UPI0021E232F1|nr:probable G-protein coupled receptor 156 [Labeo rohita]XP_050974373.1 probable G-protein coupled receptor 156 [Labeo rohita]